MEQTNIHIENPINTNLQVQLYSKKAIYGFSLFFTSIFGGVLLRQNLLDLGKKKEANNALLLSIGLTLISYVIIFNIENVGSSATLICNLIGGLILSEFYWTLHIPKDLKIENKKIWKPLIISVCITLPFIILAVLYN